MRLPSAVRKFLKKREMLQFYSQFITKEDLCFDIGANIGERTDLFLKLGATVVAVEPQSNCCKILKEKYHSKTNVTIQQLAVGSSVREDNLMICDETNECSTLSKDFVSTYSKNSNFHWQKTERIQVTTLDKLMEQFGTPTFIKIDVEGYESEVFRGLSGVIPYMSFEFNQPLLADTEKCLDIIDSLGNFKCNCIAYEFTKLILPEWIPLISFRRNLREIIHPSILTGDILVKCL